MKDRYINLLMKYSKDKELLELFDEAILDNNETNRTERIEKGKYPEPIDLLDKLRIDLMTVVEFNKIK